MLILADNIMTNLWRRKEATAPAQRESYYERSFTFGVIWKVDTYVRHTWRPNVTYHLAGTEMPM